MLRALVPFNVAYTAANTVRPEKDDGTWTTHATLATGVSVAFGVESHERKLSRPVFGRRRGLTYTVFVRDKTGEIAAQESRRRPAQRDALDWIASVLEP